MKIVMISTRPFVWTKYGGTSREKYGKVGAMPWRGRSYIEVFQSKMQPEAPAMRSIAPDVDVDAGLEATIALALRGKRMERHESASAFRSSLAELSLA